MPHHSRIRRIFKNCRLIGRRFRLAHIVFRGEIIETATFRAPVPEDGTIHSDKIFKKGGRGRCHTRQRVWNARTRCIST